jgi:hypothetical protein
MYRGVFIEEFAEGEMIKILRPERAGTQDDNVRGVG